ASTRMPLNPCPQSQIPKLGVHQHLPDSNQLQIGAPGFEPGTSPTRTARATRLRHAPTQPAVSHKRAGQPLSAAEGRSGTVIGGRVHHHRSITHPTALPREEPIGPSITNPALSNAPLPPTADLAHWLATGVSARAELFERAIATQADLLIVHHGIFWGPRPAPIDAPMKRRLKLLFDADMGLAAYHLPLDAHPEVGNNALIAQALGANMLDPVALHECEPIGCIARFPGEGIEAKALFAQIADLTARTPLV